MQLSLNFSMQKGFLLKLIPKHIKLSSFSTCALYYMALSLGKKSVAHFEASKLSFSKSYPLPPLFSILKVIDHKMTKEQKIIIQCVYRRCAFWLFCTREMSRTVTFFGYKTSKHRNSTHTMCIAFMLFMNSPN